MKTHHTTQMIVAAAAALLMASASSAALWTPAEITTRVWYDAADASTITASSGDVSAWADKSGNGNTLTQATTSRPATTGAYTINGLNVLTFDNSSGSVYQALGNSTDFSAQQYFAVAQYTSLTSNRPTIIGDTNATNYALQLEDDNTDGVPSGINGGTFYMNGSATSNENATLLANPTLVRRDWSVATWSINAGADRTQNSRSHNGYIAEIVVFETALEEDVENMVEGYLAWKWGLQGLLPGDHPYKSAAPMIEGPVIPAPAALPAGLALMGVMLVARRRSTKRAAGRHV